MDNTFDTLIIGGGASGLAACIQAKRQYHLSRVCVLERMPRVGKKLLVTGNGRCNLSNLNAEPASYSNPDFASGALGRFDVRSTTDFFESLGLYTVADSEGRVYPMSGTASSVLDALRQEAERIGVAIICDKTVSGIEKRGERFILNSGEFTAEKVIVASGGMAASVHGSDGSGYKLLESLGHKIVTVLPALVQLRCKNPLKSLKGIRAAAKIGIEADGQLFAQSSGEILFTDYGISGIAAMDVSGAVSERLAACPGSRVFAVLELAPTLSEAQIESIITRGISRAPSAPVRGLLCGILPKMLAEEVCKASINYSPSLCASDLKIEDIASISCAVKRFRLELSGTNGFRDAQICIGGADTQEFCFTTLESCKVKNLYACGEVLNVHGACGGYNLQWAWSSGRLAGTLGGEEN